MSVIEHLEALRRMLIVILVAWGITTIAGFVVSGQVVEWLVSRAGLGHAVYLGPGSFVLTRLQVAIYIGFIIAAPVVIQQIWWFVSPGLHRNERKLTLPLIVATIFFFGLGVAAALYALYPAALESDPRTQQFVDFLAANIVPALAPATGAR